MQRLVSTLGRVVAVTLVAAACSGPNSLEAQAGQARQRVQQQLGPVSAVDTTTAFKLSNTFRAAADRALPAVVYITVEVAPRVARGRQQQIPEEMRRFFEQFGMSPDDAQPMQRGPQQGAGSGFILDTQGHIMTNHHVVGEATTITVRTLDGREYPAKVIGTDANTDVAIIKIDPRPGETLPVSQLGNSDETRVGDWVLALGNPLGLNFTVTAGIVSAKGRSLDRGNTAALEAYIQTDAAINPGNSGGPLVDLYGRVIAMNTAIEGPSFMGYGFSVPINLAKRVADDLLRVGYVRRPRLGVRVQPVRAVEQEIYGLPSVSGALVASVEAGGPGAAAGLRAGDVVLALNGRPVADATALTTGLAQLQPGQEVRLTLWRDRREQTITAKLGEFARERNTDDSAPVAETEPSTALGFRVQDRNGGVVVASVDPAYTQLLVPGLRILRVNGQEVNSAADFNRIARSIKSGAAVSLLVRDPQNGDTVVNYRTR